LWDSKQMPNTGVYILSGKDNFNNARQEIELKKY
jgi:hypothetical protein